LISLERFDPGPWTLTLVSKDYILKNYEKNNWNNFYWFNVNIFIGFSEIKFKTENA